jgi:signal transduction histidine kinase
MERKKTDLKKRTGKDDIEIYYRIVNSHEEIVKIVDSMPLWVLILNENRQAVFYNQKLYHDLNATSPEDIIGKRPGEILSCKNADLDENGCGNSLFCKYCGAVNAIVNSYEDILQTEECRIIRTIGGDNISLDLQVNASPLQIDSLKCTLFVIKDISDRNRRLYLERIFLHDLVNTAFAIKSSLEMLIQETDPVEKDELLRILYPAANQLIDEISAQRQLLKTEMHEWIPEEREYYSTILLKECIDIASNYLPPKNISIVISSRSESIKFITEITLLKRVLINMLKNAIEAAENSEVISVWCSKPDYKHIAFSVHNREFLEESVRMQIFQRSFSTKGSGRGIGTYSMKLLTEQYLGGEILVESSQENGTTFTVVIPLKTDI